MTVTAEIPNNTWQVREPRGVTVLIRSTRDLTPGDAVMVQFPNTWTIVNGPSFTRELQTTDPEGEHFIGVSAQGMDTGFDVAVRSRNLYAPDHVCRHGRLITATPAAGVVPAGTPITLVYANTYAPYVSETETLWVRVRDEAPEAPPKLIVTPGPAVAMRLIVPSAAQPAEEFDVLIVSLDEFDNCYSTAYRDRTLRRSDGGVVAGGLSFTGSLRVPVTVGEEGVYRFSLGETVSTAVHVAGGLRGPFWGDIHIHTKLSGDAQGTDPYAYTREVSGLDFAGLADHCESLADPGFEQHAQWLEEADDPGRFATIPGDERNPRNWTGHHNVYFRNMQTYLRHRTDVGNMDDRRLPDDPDSAMLIPHHTGITWGGGPTAGQGTSVDWNAAGDEVGMRPVIEIYSHHGQSEYYAPQHVLAYEFNRMRNPERRSNMSTPGPFYAQEYWMAGLHVGVIGSSDEHSGQGGRRHGGIAAVFADELTREGVFDALRARRCYATTGERILIDFTVDGATMGEVVRRRKGKKLAIRLKAWGTDLLVRVDILRHRFGIDENVAPIFSIAPRPESMDFEHEMEDELTGSVLYYARIVQEPLSWPGMAWTSPVWIETA